MIKYYEIKYNFNIDFLNIFPSKSTRTFILKFYYLFHKSNVRRINDLIDIDNLSTSLLTSKKVKFKTFKIEIKLLVDIES